VGQRIAVNALVVDQGASGEVTRYALVVPEYVCRFVALRADVSRLVQDGGPGIAEGAIVVHQGVLGLVARDASVGGEHIIGLIARDALDPNQGVVLQVAWLACLVSLIEDVGGRITVDAASVRGNARILVAKTSIVRKYMALLVA